MNLMWLIIFFMILFPALFSGQDEKVAIAEDIKSGKVVLTDKSIRALNKADGIMDNVLRNCNDPKSYCAMDENSLYKAFVAKVLYERIRLESDINQ